MGVNQATRMLDNLSSILCNSLISIYISFSLFLLILLITPVTPPPLSGYQTKKGAFGQSEYRFPPYIVQSACILVKIELGLAINAWSEEFRQFYVLEAYHMIIHCKKLIWGVKIYLRKMTWNLLLWFHDYLARWIKPRTIALEFYLDNWALLCDFSLQKVLRVAKRISYLSKCFIDHC